MVKIHYQAIDLDIKLCEENKPNSRTRWRLYYGCLLDYEYIKNHYRLIAINLSRQKELDVDSKLNQQIELVRQLKI